MASIRRFFASYWGYGLVAFAVLVLAGLVITSAGSASYQATAQTLVDALTSGSLERARESLSTPPDEALQSAGQNLKAALGDKLEVSFTNGSKVFSSDPREATPPGKTRVAFDVKSAQGFVVMETLFDDATQRIDSVAFSAVRPQPNLGPFWLVLVLFLVVPAVNVWALHRVRQAAETGRWWRYLVIVVVNVPSVTFSAATGFAFDLFQAQILLGYSASLAGLASTVSVGLPIAGLLTLATLKKPGR